MTTNVATASVGTVELPSKRWMVWTGRVLSALPLLVLTASAVGKISQQQAVLDGFKGFGFPLSVVATIGAVELVCAVLYAIPRTAYLGAILATGYLGGAIATHVRVGEGFAPALILGILVWAGLFLRDERFRALLLRK